MPELSSQTLKLKRRDLSDLTYQLNEALDRGNARRALRLSRRAILYATALSDPSATTAALLGRGEALTRLGDYETAAQILQKSLTLIPKNPKSTSDRFLKASICSELGECLSTLNRSKKALPVLKEAAVLLLRLRHGISAVPERERTRWRTMLTLSYHRLAEVFADLGEARRADRYFQRSEELYARAVGENSDDVQSVETQRGRLYAQHGSFQRALRHFRHAHEKAMARSAGNLRRLPQSEREDVVQLHLAAANVHYVCDRTVLARAELRRAEASLKTMRVASPDTISERLYLRAKLAVRLHRKTQAINFLMRSICVELRNGPEADGEIKTRFIEAATLVGSKDARETAFKRGLMHMARDPKIDKRYLHAVLSELGLGFASSYDDEIARMVRRSAVHLAIKVYGRYSVETATAELALARSSWSAGRAADSKKYADCAMDDYPLEAGEYRSFEIEVLELQLCIAMADDRASVEPLLRKLIRIHSRYGKGESAEALYPLRRLVQHLLREGRYTEAEGELGRLLAVDESLDKSVDHDRALHAGNMLVAGQVADSLGETERAKGYFDTALGFARYLRDVNFYSYRDLYCAAGLFYAALYRRDGERDTLRKARNALHLGARLMRQVEPEDADAEQDHVTCLETLAELYERAGRNSAALIAGRLAYEARRAYSGDVQDDGPLPI